MLGIRCYPESYRLKEICAALLKLYQILVRASLRALQYEPLAARVRLIRPTFHSNTWNELKINLSSLSLSCISRYY